MQHSFSEMPTVLVTRAHWDWPFFLREGAMDQRCTWLFHGQQEAGHSGSSSSLLARPSCLLTPVNSAIKCAVWENERPLIYPMHIEQWGSFPPALCPWEPAKTWTHLKMKVGMLKAERSANTQGIQVLNLTASPQPTSVIDTCSKSAQQRCRPRKIHWGSVTALLFRAYKSPREPCYLPVGATQGSAVCHGSCHTWLAQGRSALPLRLLVSLLENGTLFLCQWLYVKGMSWSHGYNTTI